MDITKFRFEGKSFEELKEQHDSADDGYSLRLEILSHYGDRLKRKPVKKAIKRWFLYNSIGGYVINNMMTEFGIFESYYWGRAIPCQKLYDDYFTFATSFDEKYIETPEQFAIKLRDLIGLEYEIKGEHQGVWYYQMPPKDQLFKIFIGIINKMFVVE
jgi:hypothetical protein